MSEIEKKQRGANTNPIPQDRRLGVQFLKGFNRLFTRVYHQVEVLSPCRAPAKGRGIIICNHISGLDPELVQGCCPRLITWMMAAEYYDTPGFRWVFDTINVIPVTRSGRDMSATRLAMRALENGQLLGIFPEGKIEPTDELLPFQTGVALLALKTDSPVFPAYIDGTQRGLEMVPAFSRRQQATVAFGDEVILDRNGEGRERLDAATAGMQASVEALRQIVRKNRQSRDL